jgi:hypothetical protein
MRIAPPTRSDAPSDCWPRKPEFGGAQPAYSALPARDT